MQAGKTYAVRLVVEVRGATALTTTALRKLAVSLGGDSVFSQLNNVHSVGLTAAGNIIQTVVVSGTVKANSSSDVLTVSVVESDGRSIRIKGSMEMFEVSASALNSEAGSSNIVIRPLKAQSTSKALLRMGGALRVANRAV